MRESILNAVKSYLENLTEIFHSFSNRFEVRIYISSEMWHDDDAGVNIHRVREDFVDGTTVVAGIGRNSSRGEVLANTGFMWVNRPVDAFHKDCLSIAHSSRVHDYWSLWTESAANTFDQTERERTIDLHASSQEKGDFFVPCQEGTQSGL